MDLELTVVEKRAIASVLIDIMSADGKIAVGEVEYMNQIRLTLGISDADVDASLKMSVTQSLKILRELNHLQKQAFSHMMAEMIKADGDIDSNEVDVFTIVCLAADIAMPV